MLNLHLETRNQNSLSQMRQLGFIPGHLSVDKEKDERVFNDPLGAMVKLDQRMVKKMIAHKNDPMKVDLDGKNIGHAILLDWQRDPVTHSPIHFNLKFMSKEQLKDETLERKVPVVLGERPSTLSKEFIVKPVVKEVSLVGSLTKLPNVLEVPLDKLSFDHPLHGSDLKLPRGVKISAEEKDQIIVVLTRKAQVDEPETIESPEFPINEN